MRAHQERRTKNQEHSASITLAVGNVCLGRIQFPTAESAHAAAGEAIRALGLALSESATQADLSQNGQPAHLPGPTHSARQPSLPVISAGLSRVARPATPPRKVRT
jgi:hypothetical protein